jgi:hypothetical protein
VSYRTIEGHDAQLPCVRLDPPTTGERTVIWLDARGKDGLYDDEGNLIGPVRRLLEGGLSVVGADLLYQGEFLADRRPLARQRCLENEQGFAGWTYCYNLPLAARRAHDILAIGKALKADERAVDLAAFGPAAAWAAAAAAQSHGTIDRVALDTQGFRFAQVADVYGANFLPGAVKYGDLPGVLALIAPRPLLLTGEEKPGLALVAAAYRAAAGADRLTTLEPTGKTMADAVAQWLLNPRGD